MSHAATKWAIEQRGIKPAAKIVLWQLCDRFHPDNGCFPSQEVLANDCEMSRSALNSHLDALEVRGLIAREARRDPATKQQERTRYRFPFEEDFVPVVSEEPCSDSGHGAESGKAPEPCPENDESRVRNPDTNLVREPVREPVKVEREARASGQGSMGEASAGAERPAPEGQPPKADARTARNPEDDHGFQKLLKRYPGAHSPGLAFPAWLRLDDEGRRRALARLDAYLAERRKLKNDTVFALQRYLGERIFDQVGEPAEGQPVQTLVRPRSDEWWALFWRRRKAGEPIKFMLDRAKAGSGWGCAVDALPAAEEISALSEIEVGSAAFRAWDDALRREGLRLGGEACGKFIRVPSEWPPGMQEDLERTGASATSARGSTAAGGRPNGEQNEEGR